MYSEPMKTLSVVEICVIETPIALAFSRSIVTSSCGSLAEKVVISPVSSLCAAPGAHNLVRHAVQIGQRVAALVLQHELKSAEAAHALDGRRLECSHQAAVGHKHQHLQLGRNVLQNVGRRVGFSALRSRCSCSQTSCRHWTRCRQS